MIRIVYFCHQSIQQRKKLQKCRQCTKILPKIIFQKQFIKQIFFTLKLLQNLTFFSMSQSKSLAGVVITGAGQNFRLVLHIFVNFNLLKITYCEFSQVWKIFSWICVEILTKKETTPYPLQLWEINPGSWHKVQGKQRSEKNPRMWIAFS